VSKADWALLTSGGHDLNSSGGDVTLVEFIDYQCPVCARIEPVLSALEASSNRRLRRLIRHLPLQSIHPNAESASLALECAAREGRLKAMHQVLLQRQSDVGIIGWDSLATLAGVERPGKLLDCMRSEETAARVHEDQELALQLGFSGTPTLIADRALLTGLSPVELRSFLQRKLK
jgi:protein-disulfide isomerase